MFLVIDWLDFHRQWHLTFTVIENLRATESERCIEKSNAATTCSGYINYELNRLRTLQVEQYWGTH